MGDRANVYVKDQFIEGIGVYLYTHWGGYELPAIVQKSLHSTAGRNRWHDSGYLARIIFGEMVKGCEDSETGFGISARMMDNGYPIIVLCCKSQRFRLCEAGKETEPLDATNSLPFDEFPSEWPNEDDDEVPA
jgi:hypothetical protein